MLDIKRENAVKFLRILLSVIILLVGIVAVMILCFFLFLDPNKLKPALIDQVKKYTDYQLQFDGKLSWSFYPYFNISIPHMTLTAAHESEPFADLRDTKLAMSLSQFLHNRTQFQSNIEIGEIVFLKLHAKNAHVNLHWQDQVLTLHPIVASLYHGSLQGSATGRDLLGPSPIWDWNVNSKDIQLKPLLEDVIGMNSKIKISGAGQFSTQGTTKGKTRQTVLQNLNGTNKLMIENGDIQGMDINYLIQSADAIINNQPLTAPTSLNQTHFDSLVATGVMHGGTVTTNDLLLQAPAFLVKVVGDVNLNSQTLNLKLLINPQKTIKTQWAIPVDITGSFNQPNVHLDVSEIQKIAVKQELEKVKNKVKEIPGKAGEFLQHIIGK